MALTIKQGSKYEGEDWWTWWVWIDGTNKELNTVDHVVYTLHRTFPNPVRTVSDRTSLFRLETAGWGTFTLYCKVVHKNGTILKLSHELKLSRRPVKS